MSVARVYLNLTNGLEILFSEDLRTKIELLAGGQEVDFTPRVIRIQSTALEQKRWDFVIQDLDHGLLFDLATGNTVIVVDYSSHKPESRALYQGLPFIRYVLTRYWLGREEIPWVKKHNVQFLFRKLYSGLNSQVFAKLSYYRQFLLTESINLRGYAGGKSRLEGPERSANLRSLGFALMRD